MMQPMRNPNILTIQRVQSSISIDSDCVPESYYEPEFDLSVGNYTWPLALTNNHNCDSMEETKLQQEPMANNKGQFQARLKAMRQQEAESKKAAYQAEADIYTYTDQDFAQIIFEETALTKTRKCILLNPRNKCLFI